MALIAAGTMIRAWSIPVFVAAAARIGISSVVVAVLLVTSVRKVTARQIIRIISNNGSCPNPANAAPRVTLKPELTKAMQNYLDLHRHAAVRTELLGHQGIALRLAVAQIIRNGWGDGNGDVMDLGMLSAGVEGRPRSAAILFGLI